MSHFLSMLFSRTSTGDIQQWQIEIEGNKFRTHSGKVGGKIVIAKWTITEGKNIGRSNQTSPEEQALVEAQAKWQKKHDSGYRESTDDIDDIGFTEPMLAHNWDDYGSEAVYPLYCQPKLDGIRCIIRADGMWSRKGKLFVSAPHIFETLKPLFDANPSLILDGELYCNKFANDFDKVCSVIRKTKPDATDLAYSREVMQYWIYDMPSDPGVFSVRSENLRKLLTPYTATNMVVVLETHKVGCEQELTDLYEKWIDEGYEGQIIRTDATYEFKRTKRLLKRKEFQDREYKILDIVEGEGNRTGTAGYMVFKSGRGIVNAGDPSPRTGDYRCTKCHFIRALSKGNTIPQCSCGNDKWEDIFRSNIKGNMDKLKDILNRKAELIGQEATIKFFRLTPDGIPRFPYVTTIRDYE